MSEKGVIVCFSRELVFCILLAGSMPPELGNLAALQQLYLGGNKLSGESLDNSLAFPITYFEVFGNVPRRWLGAIQLLDPQKDLFGFLTCQLIHVQLKLLQLGEASQLLGYGPCKAQRSRKREIVVTLIQ